MKKLLTATVILLLFAGCGETFVPEAGRTVNSGSAEGPKPVPNSAGRTTDDLEFDEDLRCYSMDNSIDDQVVTTQETLGRWKEGKDKDKYAVQGLSYLSTSSMNADGFADVFFVYYNKAIDGPFKISARVRMTAINSNTTSKGVQFGAFAPLNQQEADGGQKFTNVSRSAGIQVRTGIAANNPVGEVRYYYAKDGARIDNHAGSSSTGGDQILINTNWKTEYILEVSRDSNSNYRFAVLNSKTGDVVPYAPNAPPKPPNNPRTIAPEPVEATSTTLGNNAFLHESLKHGQPVFPGMALMGSSAEISQIKIWDIFNPDPDGSDDAEHLLFSTPSTEPAYVPVEQLTGLVFAPAKTRQPNSNPPLFKYTFSEISANGITLTTNASSFVPAWADNYYLEWFIESCTVNDAVLTDPRQFPVNIAGNGTPKTVTGVFEDDGETLKNTWLSGKITVDGSKMPTGTASVVCKAVSRDLDLDSGVLPPNYSLLQTLAEYRFVIEVAR
jgi:hypothetical protein